MCIRTDLGRARATILEAQTCDRATERYLAAHLAALRVAAVLLSCRARPGRVGARPRDAWQVLAEVAPEFAEWASYFAATSVKGVAVRSGGVAAVNARDADDLVRDAEAFLLLVERTVLTRPAGPGT